MYPGGPRPPNVGQLQGGRRSGGRGGRTKVPGAVCELVAAGGADKVLAGDPEARVQDSAGHRPPFWHLVQACGSGAPLREGLGAPEHRPDARNLVRMPSVPKNLRMPSVPKASLRQPCLPLISGRSSLMASLRDPGEAMGWPGSPSPGPVREAPPPRSYTWNSPQSTISACA